MRPTAVLIAAAAVAAATAAAWFLLAPGPAPIGPPPSPATTAAADAPPRIDYGHFEDGGLGIAAQFTGAIRDPSSLDEIRRAVERGAVAPPTLAAELQRARADGGDPAHAAELLKLLGLAHLYNGDLDAAAAAFRDLEAARRDLGAGPEAVAEAVALRGITALRRGEADNCIACLGPSSCIFPIAPEAAHARQEGSREAVEHFKNYLNLVPGDLRVRWLLNLACMTLGDERLRPEADRIPINREDPAEGGVPRFENVAVAAGLTARPPNQAGGSVFDDLDGDGRPDIVSTSLDVDRGPSLFLNRGDGTFEDRSDSAGLAEQVYALNVVRADYDNDGDLDLLLLRGGWEAPMRMSLLRNDGQARFEDVTEAAGLGLPISSETAAWADDDNDGDLDLFVGGEFLPPLGRPPGFEPDPRNRPRLYRNNGDGTFVDVAEVAGIVNEQCAKGSAWGDFDGDGFPDLYISNMTGPGRLYRNNGDGTFRDVAADLGVTGPGRGFACWFWDFDDDGRPDLFVNDYTHTLAEAVATTLGLPGARSCRPRLYRNLGPDGFRDVSRDVGLDRPAAPMGCNFGDIDDDGDLDFYLGTGVMSYEYLVPNRMFLNEGGRAFRDVTLATGTGHLQKGHGVSFADDDDDGDLDVFVEAGGGVPGDRSHNLLFRNPGTGRRSLRVKLVGTTSNRPAIGARIRAVVDGPGGSTRTIHRTIGDNSSFGGNSLVAHLGLGDATSVRELVVSWPTSKTTQTFRDLAAGRTVVITEGRDDFEERPYRGPTPPP